MDTLAPAIRQTKRTSRACVECRKSHQPCEDGGKRPHRSNDSVRPCAQCHRKGKECVESGPRKRRRGQYTITEPSLLEPPPTAPDLLSLLLGCNSLDILSPQHFVPLEELTEESNNIPGWDDADNDIACKKLIESYSRKL